MSMNQFKSGQPAGYSSDENNTLKPPATRGRPSNLEKGGSDNLPAIITGYLFGDALAHYTRQQIAEKLDECIVKNSRQSQRCRTYVAMALYTAKTLRTFQDSGYRNWEDYIKAMVVRHQSFGTPRHAGRYIHAVETWIVKMGYEPSLLEKYGPSALGEIAEAGVVRDAKDAQGWLRLLESHAVGDLRKVIKEHRDMLIAPEGGQKQLAQFDPNSDDDEESVPLSDGSTLAQPAPMPQMGPQSAPMNTVSDEGEDEGTPVEVIDMTPPPLPQMPESFTQADSVEVSIVESKTPAGAVFFTTYIKKNGILIEKYTSGKRPVIREMVEDEATDLNREKRNVRVAEQMQGLFGQNHGS